MAYDLLAVGGTGQSVLLELLFRAQRTGLDLLPREIWILDRELDTWGDLIETQQDALPRKSTQAALIKITTARPAVPRNAAAQTMSTILNGSFDSPPEKLPQILASILTEALTPPEWTQGIEDGFFALPRLAAAWFGIVGLESQAQFLDSAYLTTRVAGESHPLFVVGSVAGGTGAGLIPSLLHAFRLAPPKEWARDLWIFPFLPYFDPQASRRADKRINLVQCRWNAAHAIQELERERALLHARLVEAISDEAERALVPSTSISLIPPLVDDPAQLRDIHPPDPDDVAIRKSFDGAIGRGVDHILAVDAYLSNPKKHLAADAGNRTHIGVLQVPQAQLRQGAGAGGYTGGRRNGIVSEMIVSLRDEIVVQRDPVRAVPGVIAASGLGRTFERIFHARTLAKRRDRTTTETAFWEAFDARLTERADQISARAGGVSIGQDLDRIIALIDEYSAREQRRTEILRMADANDAGSGILVADRIADSLLSAAELESAEILRQTAYEAFVPAMLVGTVSTSSFGQVPVYGEFTSPSDAASAWSARWRPEEDPRSFRGSSRAKLMGHAHAYADYVTNAKVGGGAPGADTPLGIAWLLWKAAVAGLLEFSELQVDFRSGERWTEAEDWDADFGGYVILMTYQRTPVAFSSADMGIVPAAQLSDRPARAEWEPHERAKAALTQLTKAVAQIEKRRLDDQRDSLADVLNDFSKHLGKGNGMPWEKLLLYEDRPRAGVATGEILGRTAIPSQRLWLRLEKDQHPVEVRIPLVVDVMDDVRRVAYATADASLERSSLLFWESSTLYYREGEEKLPLLSICGARAESGNYVKSFTPLLQRATGALPVQRDASPDQPQLFELSWPSAPTAEDGQ
jgi:hypothetical protein